MKKPPLNGCGWLVSSDGAGGFYAFEIDSRDWFQRESRGWDTKEEAWAEWIAQLEEWAAQADREAQRMRDAATRARACRDADRVTR